MGIILASSTAVTAAESGGTFSKLAGMGALGTVALIVLAGLGLLALLLTLIGWVGVLADYQKHGGITRTALWGVAVFCLPILGTVLWAVIARRREPRGRETVKAPETPARPTAAPRILAA